MTATGEPTGRTVLLVDDNETTRYVFGRWLRRAGFTVLEASNGTDALELLVGVVPDIAVLDVNLPDMSGFDILDRVKALDASVPVLHVSATAVDVADRSTGLMRGADNYLIEPVEREELLATVESLLRYSTARRRAERLATQLLALHDGAVAVHDATSVDQLCLVAAQSAARILGRTLAVAAFAEHEGMIALAGTDGAATVTAYRPGALVDSTGGLSPTAGVIRSRAVDSFVPPSDLDSFLAPLRGREVNAIVTRHPRGTGVAGVLIDGPLTEESDRLLAAQILRSLAVAVDNLRLYEIERGLALRLQRSLLPERAPVVEGLRIATRYVASEDHAQIGGDFFEAFAVDDHRVALAIGDVGGHSLEAASVMGELRAGLRAYVIEGLAPATIVARLNQLLRRFWPTMIATMSFALLDQRTRRLSVVNAGHLPLLVVAGGRTWWLTGGCTLLGVSGTVPSTTTVELPAGATVLFATDGLVERRDQFIDEGMARMAAAARAHHDAGPDGLCEAVIERCRPKVGSFDDDVALMVVELADGDPPAGAEPRIVEGDQMALLEVDPE